MINAKETPWIGILSDRQQRKTNMETIQAIRSRRSIRKYQPKPVPHEVIEQIVADAAYAPSWKNTQIAR